MTKQNKEQTDQEPPELVQRQTKEHMGEQAEKADKLVMDLKDHDVDEPENPNLPNAIDTDEIGIMSKKQYSKEHPDKAKAEVEEYKRTRKAHRPGELYAEGVPKSVSFDKKIDKELARRERVGKALEEAEWVDAREREERLKETKGVLRRVMLAEEVKDKKKKKCCVVS